MSKSASLILEEIRYTGDELPGANLGGTIQIGSVVINLNSELQHNYYRKLNLVLYDQEYDSPELNINVVSAITLNSGVPINQNFNVIFNENPQVEYIIEKDYHFNDFGNPPKSIWLKLRFRKKKRPAFCTEFEAISDCLFQIIHFYEEWSWNGMWLNDYLTLYEVHTSNVFNAVKLITNNLNIVQDIVFNPADNFETKLSKTIELLKTLCNNWQSTISNQNINDVRSAVTNFKNTLSTLIENLKLGGYDFCNKYFEWKGPGELAGYYEDLNKCLCLYEAQYNILNQAAKDKIDTIRTKMALYIQELNALGEITGYGLNITAGSPVNLCEDFVKMRTIIDHILLKSGIKKGEYLA